MLFPAVDTVPVTWGLFSALVRRAGTAQVASNSLALVVATAPTTVYATMPHATVSLAMTVLGAKSRHALSTALAMDTVKMVSASVWRATRDLLAQ